MLCIQSVRPHAAIQPFIHSFVQRDAALGSLEVIEPVIVRLGVMVEFKFAGLYEIRTYLNNSTVRPNRISVVGPQTFRRVRLTLCGDIDSLAVMFQPCGFHALFGIPANSVSDISVEGPAVLGNAVSRLYEQLGNLRTFSERVSLLNSFFLHCFRQIRGIPAVYHALHQLTVCRSISIPDAARQAGLSRRQLERKSLVCAGVVPKTLFRIGRIPGLSFPFIVLLILAFFFAGPGYDLISRHRIHPVYRWIVPSMLILGPLTPLMIVASRAWAWHTFTDWLIR